MLLDDACRPLLLLLLLPPAPLRLQVPAGPALVAALLQAPLVVSVYKQPAAAGSAGSSAGTGGSGGSSGSSRAAAGRTALLVGTAEIDLAPLLWSSSSDGAGEEQQLLQRCVAGSYPLLEGAAASQGGASLAARVQLQLLPLEGAAQQAATAAAAGADAAAGAWELKGGSGGQRSAQPLQQAGVGLEGSSSGQQAGPLQLPPPPSQQQQQQQQHMLPLSTPSTGSCSEEDELGEELLQRCRQLREAVAAAAGARAAAPPSSSNSSNSSGVARGQLQGQQQTDADAGQQQAGGGDSQPHGASSSQGEQLQQGQQGQQGQLPEGSPAGGGPAGSATLLQEERPGTSAEAAEPGRLLVRVETALHLPTTAAAGGARAYVQAVWGAQRQHQQRTAAVPVHVVAAADLGGTAVWNADLALPAVAASWASRGGGDSSSSGSFGPVLLLNVWSTAAAEGSGTAGGAAAVLDALIGCAVVDLSVLPLLREQQGWWHIVGSAEQQQGQLKASVRPDSLLLQQLCSQATAAVSGSAHSVASPQAAAPAAAENPPQQQQRQEQHDLVQQLQAQLQELELLSQRLAAEPPASTAAAAAAAAAGAVLAAPEELPASDDEGLAPFDARQVGGWAPAPACLPACLCQQPPRCLVPMARCALLAALIATCLAVHPLPPALLPAAPALLWRHRSRATPGAAATAGTMATLWGCWGWPLRVPSAQALVMRRWRGMRSRPGGDRWGGGGGRSASLPWL